MILLFFMGCGVVCLDWLLVFGMKLFILFNVLVDGLDCGGCEENFGKIGGVLDVRGVELFVNV